MTPEHLLQHPCQTPDQLHAWVKLFCGIDVPRTSVCAHHDAPFDYLKRAYFEPASDQVVHAPRGGGKTRLAAVATLLDLLHKPQIQIRILGGSLEQSLKMWEHLLPDLEERAPHLLAGKGVRGKRVTLSNGSSVAVLTQSERAVRGLRVQKIRCDEVELFKPDIWEAAQLATRSRGRVHGAIDALSTLHTPGGLMQHIIDSASQNNIPVVKWCLIDVLEHCPQERSCETCPLWDECQGQAKRSAGGFVKIDDAIRMKARVSRETWECEMLCQRPSVKNAVYPHFDPQHHVREFEPTEGQATSLAVDFGFAAPFVCLWMIDTDEQVRVVDEYVQPRRTLEEHLAMIHQRPWARAKYVACDPAGAGQNDQTAMSNVQLFRSSGYVVRTKPSRIVDGIELVRRAIRPATGVSQLLIHPRCKHLIASLSGYRYPHLSTGSTELPEKDGTHDHACDALRYWFINRNRVDEVKVRVY
jgi:Terminase RNaseH-like domain